MSGNLRLSPTTKSSTPSRRERQRGAAVGTAFRHAVGDCTDGCASALFRHPSPFNNHDHWIASPSIAPVRSIEPWKDSGKWVLNFSEPAAEIPHVVLDKGGKVSAPQSLRYTSRERLLAAKTLDDIWQQ
jgi:hypothetical protein